MHSVGSRTGRNHAIDAASTRQGTRAANTAVPMCSSHSSGTYRQLPATGSLAPPPFDPRRRSPPPLRPAPPRARTAPSSAFVGCRSPRLMRHESHIMSNAHQTFSHSASHAEPCRFVVYNWVGWVVQNAHTGAVRNRQAAPVSTHADPADTGDWSGAAGSWSPSDSPAEPVPAPAAPPVPDTPTVPGAPSPVRCRATQPAEAGWGVGVCRSANPRETPLCRGTIPPPHGTPRPSGR